MRSKSGHGRGHGHGRVVVVLFLFMFLQLSFATDTYLGMWEHKNCDMSTCELDSVTNTSCTNGTVLSEYCEPGYSACCLSAASCSEGYGGCVDLQSSGCHSGPAVLGVCEDWEGGAPFDVFCCDEDSDGDELNNKRDKLMIEIIIAIVLCTIFVAFVHFIGLCGDYESNDDKVMSVFMSVVVCVSGGATLVALTATIQKDFGSSDFITIAYVLFAIFVVTTICACKPLRCLHVGLFLYFMILLYLYVKSQNVKKYDLYTTPLYTTSHPSLSPILFPTAEPSISANPTATCPLGYDQTSSCEPCPVGQYGDATGCHDCDTWKWTLDSGSESCEYFTAQKGIDPLYAVILCIVYTILSLVCFIYYVQVTGRWIAVVSIMLISGDQVTDILYAQFSIFSNRLLLICSVCFCLFNLVVQGTWLISNANLKNMFVVTWNTKWTNYLVRKEWDSWKLHDILKVEEITRSLELCFVMVFLDMFWVCFRILIILLITLFAVICQILFLITGMVFSTTKLMSTPQVFEAFWGVWNPEQLNLEENAMNSDALFNLLVTAELVFENIPQIIIQVSNSYYQSSWNTLVILSLSLSVLMMFSVGNHFRYHVLVKGKSFTDVPKYDILAEMIAACKSNEDRSPELKEDLIRYIPTNTNN